MLWTLQCCGHYNLALSIAVWEKVAIQNAIFFLDYQTARGAFQKDNSLGFTVFNGPVRSVLRTLQNFAENPWPDKEKSEKKDHRPKYNSWYFFYVLISKALFWIHIFFHLVKILIFIGLIKGNVSKSTKSITNDIFYINASYFFAIRDNCVL